MDTLVLLQCFTKYVGRLSTSLKLSKFYCNIKYIIINMIKIYNFVKKLVFFIVFGLIAKSKWLTKHDFLSFIDFEIKIIRCFKNQNDG